MRIAAATIIAIAFACAAQAQTTVYKWVDKDGKVQYSSEPPPSDAENVTQRRMGNAGGDDTSLPYATRQASQRNPVTLYVSNNCGELCADGRTLLSNRGIPYSERNAETNPEEREKLRQLAGALSVPFLTVGDRQVKGFDENSWNAALDGAGYPRTRLPGQLPTRPSTEAPAAK
jgi:glutaredoxin